MTDAATDARERQDLLETLAKHRGFVRQAVDGVTDEQARSRPTVSELSLGGIVKHLTRVERNWVDFVVNGPPVVDEARYAEHVASFQMGEDDTLAALFADYDAAAAETDELLRTVPSLDDDQPLPEAPWNPPGARWSARRVFVHLVAETAQHAGHADILRETIDGSKTMG